MSEHHEHNPGDHEDPLAGPTWMIGFVGVVLLVVTVLGVAAVTYSVADREHEHKVVEELGSEGTIELRVLRESQLARLAGPPRRELRDHPERPGGEECLVIPIDDAIDRWVEGAQGQ
jgi:hypothetical protein